MALNKPYQDSKDPGEILDWLRQEFSEDAVDRLLWKIGGIAGAEAMKDIWAEAEKNTPILEPKAYGLALLMAVDELDPAKGGGHYPSRMICSHHHKCPGVRVPWCVPWNRDIETGR